MKAVLIANPNAGGPRRGPESGTIARRLQQAGICVREAPAAEPGQVSSLLRRVLREESPDETRILVAGGDGTLNAVLPALIGTHFPLALLPCGTLNALAGELGIPRLLDEAIAVALAGRPRRIDLGLANGRPFAQMAGVGFDGAVVHSVLPSTNKSFLSIPALARGLRLLTEYTPPTVRLTTDRALIEAHPWLVLIANARHYTYKLRVAPGAVLDDGWLDVWLFEAGSTSRLLRQVIALLAGRPDSSPGVRHLRARRLRIESDPPVFFHVDGDPAGRTPVEIGIIPAAISIIAPAARVTSPPASLRPMHAPARIS